MSENKRPVIFVVGTTASGKTDWSLKLAQEFNGVIFNCDSVQLYQRLDIGAAKPTLEERALVPHYLLDYVAPPQEMTAGQYTRDFYAQMESLPGTNPVFVVGGTGFYFMAIEKGMYPVVRVSEELQKAVLAEMQAEGGPEKLHRELAEIDPEYAAKIHLADHYRLGRAIELVRSEGRSVTAIQKEFSESQSTFPYPLLKIGPTWDREVLKERIALRTQKMLDADLITEVQTLLDEGLESWAPLSSVGYKETLDFLKGRIPREELFEQITTNTRQLAKKQRTWFQRDKAIHWAPGDTGFAETRLKVETFLAKHTSLDP